MSKKRSRYLGTQITEQTVVWEKTKDPFFPYAGEAVGHKCAIRLNDFPDEPLYTLFIDGEMALHLEDWPPPWIRPLLQEDDKDTVLNYKVGKLIGRLRPFAELINLLEDSRHEWSNHWCNKPDDYSLWGTDTGSNLPNRDRVKITLGDLRRARSVLAEIEK